MFHYTLTCSTKCFLIILTTSRPIYWNLKLKSIGYYSSVNTYNVLTSPQPLTHGEGSCPTVKIKTIFNIAETINNRGIQIICFYEIEKLLIWDRKNPYPFITYKYLQRSNEMFKIFNFQSVKKVPTCMKLSINGFYCPRVN